MSDLSFVSTITKKYYQIDYCTFRDCQFLLEDAYIRRVANAFTDEILAGKVELTVGKAKNAGSKDDQVVAKKLVEKLGPQLLDQVYIMGFALILLYKEKNGTSATVVQEGLGEWYQLWIQTDITSGERKYRLRILQENGQYVEVKEDGFVVLDCFGFRPTYQGKITSILTSLIEPWRFHQIQKIYEEHASYNTSHPAIVTETEAGALGTITMEDLIGKHVGWSAEKAITEVGENGRLAQFEYEKSATEISVLVQNARKLLDQHYDTISEGGSAIDKIKDQTRGAIRPLGPGHHVAHHHMAQIRSDVVAITEQYYHLVANAFGIDRGGMVMSGTGSTTIGEAKVMQSERFMILALNRYRKSLSDAITQIYRISVLYPTLTKITRQELEEEPDIISNKWPYIEILPAPPMKFEELVAVNQSGVFSTKDFLQQAEALFGRELHGTGIPKVDTTNNETSKRKREGEKGKQKKKDKKE
jgi:hypothetical protein